MKIINVYNHFPINFKKKSIIFIFLIIFSSILEIFSIGILFPLLKYLIDGSFSNNFFGINFNNLFLRDNFITIFLAFIILLYFFKTLFLIVFNYWQLKFSSNIFKYLSIKLFNKYLISSIAFYHKNNSAILLKNTFTECKNFGHWVELVLKIMAEILVVLFIILLLFYIEPIKTLIIFIAVSFFSIFFYLMTNNKIYLLGIKKLSASEKVFKTVLESFNGIRDIKIKASEDFFLKKYVEDLQKFLKSGNYQMAIIQAPRVIFEFLFVLFLIIGLMIMTKNGSDIYQSLSLIGMYIVSSFRLIPGIMRILTIKQSLKSLQPSIEMLNKQLENTNISDEKFRIKNNKSFDFKKSLKIDNISFSYENENYVFKNFSIQIKKNQILGIFGESGSGKSTLVDIITGLIKPNEGKILIDDKININDGYLIDWHKKIGYVSQNLFLLDDTLIKNIAFGTEEGQINKEKIHKVLKSVKLLDYFNNQKNKLDTNVGERGIKLSGGQIQRIGIARELYKDPQLIIFDESTNALDEVTENQILECIKELSKNITVIIISHKKDVLKICDEIININKFN